MNIVVIINDETNEVRICLVDDDGDLIQELDPSKFTVNLTSSITEQVESTKFNISLL